MCAGTYFRLDRGYGFRYFPVFLWYIESHAKHVVSISYQLLAFDIEH